MAQSFRNSTHVVRVKGAVAAGTTNVTDATGVDCSGYERATFFVAWGVITASGVQSIEVHQSSDDGGSDSYTAVIGSKVTVADDDDAKITMVEIYRPVEKWLKVVINRATQNSVVELAWCILSDPSVSAAALSSTVSGYEEHASPIEGTA